jgi:hypothetical protein
MTRLTTSNFLPSLRSFSKRDSVRLATLIYFTELPIYLYALRAAPYAFVPSFIWFKYKYVTSHSALILET